MKEYKRRLIKFSNYSLCVTLPKAMLDKLELGKGDEVVIRMKRGKILVEPSTETTPRSSEKGSGKGDAWKPVPELGRDKSK